MRKWNKWMAICLTVILAFVTVGCRQSEKKAPSESKREESSQESEAAGLYLSMATNSDWSTSFKGKIMGRELEALAQQTDGALKIKLYDRSRLGDDAHLISGVQTGTIDIIQSSPASQINVVPEAAFLDVPGLFDTLEEWNAFFEGEYHEVMKRYYEEAGLELLDVFAYSWRNVSSREPVQNLTDLKGVRIRTIKNKYHEAFWNYLGASAVPYDYAELYFCISEGMADAQENFLDVMLVDNLYEIQKCVTVTHHLPMVGAFAMSRDLYGRLTGEEREMLAQFTGNLKEALMAQMPEEEERLLETLDNDYGIEILTPSAQLQAQIHAGRDFVLSLLREDLGDQKVDTFLDAVEKVRQTAATQSAIGQ